jgi:hypothetical protein
MHTLIHTLFRYLYYLVLFSNMMASFCVIVCFMYWVLLGTVLDPEAIVPIAMGIGALITHAVSYWKMLVGVRSKFMSKIAHFEGKAEDMQKAMMKHSKKIAKLQTELIAKAEEGEKVPPEDLEKLSRMNEQTKGAHGESGRVGSMAEQFLMSKGLQMADIIILVTGSVTILFLLIMFIYLGVMAFAEPGVATASVHTTLNGLGGKVVNGNAKVRVKDKRCALLI